jgi:hypothetical protein
MFQAHDAASNRRNATDHSLFSESSDRLRSSITNEDILQYHKQQRGATSAGATPSGTDREERCAIPKPGTRPSLANLHPEICGKPRTSSNEKPQPDQRTQPNEKPQPDQKPQPKTEKPQEVTPSNVINIPIVATVTQFRQRVERIFTEMDQSKDGFLSRREVASAVQNRKYTGADAQVIAGIFDAKAFNALANVSEDQPGPETYLSRRDIQQMEVIQKSPARGVDQIIDWTWKNFDRLDTDKNGFIHSSELDRIANDKGTGSNDKIMANTVKQLYETLQTSSDDEWFWENDGITKSDIAVWALGFKDEFAKVDALDLAMLVSQRTFSGQLESIDTLYAGKPRNAISPDAVKQGLTGDCYFLAALASIAKESPDRIEKMIKDNKNGTYTVTFAGDPTHPVTVPAPTEAEQGLYNAGTKFGTWASVMERAFGQWRLDRKNSREQNPLTVIDATNGPDSGAFAMAVLTGNGSAQFAMSDETKESIAARLDYSFNKLEKPNAVTAGVHGPEARTKDGWYTGHLYSVLGYEPISISDGWVTIRNPWGRGENTVDGTKRIRLDEFHRNFSGYMVENRGNK